jgi:hypothetical protein
MMTSAEVDQMMAYAKFAGEVLAAAERAENLPQLQDAIKAAARELRRGDPRSATTKDGKR